MGLEPDQFRRVHAAFVAGDGAALRQELGHLPGFPDVSLDPAIGLPLVYAIYHGPRSLVEELLGAGADPNADDGDGFPPLIAALSGAVPARGAAARDDAGELVELLLAAGAQPGQRGVNDETPLHFAASQGDLVMVERLLRHGADPDAITRIDDMETPLEVAERTGHVDVAERLRSVTTRPDWERAGRDGDLRVLERMIRAGHDIDATDGYGQTALMRASHAGRADAVRWLIENGADLDHRSKFNLSALMLAVVAGHEAIARTLVRAGADLDIVGSGAPGFAGKTAAALAEEAGQRRLAAFIRDHPRGAAD